MTSAFCPTCKRFFDEPGYCPFDRTPLLVPPTDVGDGPETLPSMAMPAATPPPPTQQAAPASAASPTEASTRTDTSVSTKNDTALAGHDTEVRSDTAVSSATAERVAARPAPLPAFRAQSASESTGAALAAIAAGRVTEYDKLVGQTLDGRYHIERKIGEGGMGVVFAARHAVIERPLAIKVLKREVMRDTATIKRFVQEAKAASRIGHPNIVDVTDFGTTADGLTYQVMEYVDGKTLGQALREGAPFKSSRAIRIVSQLARALGAAHDKGIVHRDLKPENIFLLDRDGRKDFVKLVDFGIAKVAPPSGQPADGPRLTRAGAVFGTPEYMAPEQAAGRGDTDGRVDIYALGIIAYEMVTGRVPFRGDTMVRTLAMQMLDPVEPPSRVRPDLLITADVEAVIMKALAKKREQRYATMTELLEDLQKAAGTPLIEPVSASITDASAFKLQTIPPGADRAIVRSTSGSDRSAPVPAAVALSTDRSSPAMQIGQVTSETRPSQPRYKDEPAFVTARRPAPPTLDQLDAGTGSEPIYLPTRARWPMVLVALIVVGGAGVAVAMYARSRTARDDQRVVVPADAATVAMATDAPATPPPGPDATVTVLTPLDAATTRDDAARVASANRDARRDGSGVPPGVRLTPRGTVAIKVHTIPEGGNVYFGFEYRGAGEPTVEADYGTKVRIRCTLGGHNEGTVDVTFDGKTDEVWCRMLRIKRCVKDLKNPFDECKEDGSGSGG
jgi:serine/threonine protein kinase